MNPSVSEMCNWLGAVDAKASELLDVAASSGVADVANVASLKACVTTSVVFLAQLLRGLEHEGPGEPLLPSESMVADRMIDAFAAIEYHFDSPIRRN